MGGDHMGGLATLIAIAMGMMALVPAVLLGLLGFFALRKRGHGAAGAILGALLGVGGGVLAAISTFYERTWDPPNVLALDVPPGFDEESIVFLVDASAPEVEWSGISMPFVERHAHLAVPPSGVVHVHDIDWLEGGALDVTLSTGARPIGLLYFVDDAVLGAGAVYQLAEEGGRREPALADDYRTPAFAARILERDARR